MVQIRNRNSKFQVIILRKIANGYKFVVKTNIDIEQEKFEYKDHTYLINIEDSAFVDKDGNTIMFYELNGNQLSFKKIRYALDSSELDNYLSKKLIAQIISRLKDALGGGGTKSIIAYIIIGAIIGVFVGMVITAQFFPTEVVRYVFTNSTGTYPIVPS